MQTMIHHRCRFAAIVFVIQDTWKRIVQWFLLVDSDPSTFVLYPQQENFTLVINTPTIDFNYGGIGIGHLLGYHYDTYIYFYIAPNNTIYLTTTVIYAPGDGIHQLTKYIEPPPTVLPSHTPVYTAEQLEFTKDFIQENYPDADIEQKLRDLNQPEEFIEQFFSTYPELRKQSPQTCIYDGSWFAFLCIFF